MDHAHWKYWYSFTKIIQVSNLLQARLLLLKIRHKASIIMDVQSPNKLYVTCDIWYLTNIYHDFSTLIMYCWVVCSLLKLVGASFLHVAFNLDQCNKHEVHYIIIFGYLFTNYQRCFSTYSLMQYWFTNLDYLWSRSLLWFTGLRASKGQPGQGEDSALARFISSAGKETKEVRHIPPAISSTKWLQDDLFLSLAMMFLSSRLLYAMILYLASRLKPTRRRRKYY